MAVAPPYGDCATVQAGLISRTCTPPWIESTNVCAWTRSESSSALIGRTSAAKAMRAADTSARLSLTWVACELTGAISPSRVGDSGAS